MLHIRLLGNFSIVHNDQPVAALTRPQLKTLLAYLTLHRTRPAAREEVALLLSPASGDTQAKTNLRKLLFELRQRFPTIEAYLEITDNTLGWKPAAAYLSDIAEFEAALQAAAQPTEVEVQQAALAHVFDCYTGDLWPECREEWIFAERERLRNLYIGALEQFIALLELQRDYVGALHAAQRLLHHNPLREESYRWLMHLYACMGDQVGIERTFQECRTLLARKLKVTPSLPTCDLYERLTQVAPVGHSLATLPLIERRHEWAHLQSAWAEVLQGKPHCIWLTGDAGIGKTRLLTEFRSSVERHGMATIAIRCHPFTRTIAYAPLLEWLRTPALRRRIMSLVPVWRNELVRLLPELQTEELALSLPLPPFENRVENRQHLYEALTHLCLAPAAPLLLVIDDLQWCDQATIDWLHYLLHNTPTAKLLLVGTLAALELRPHYPLTTWWPRLQQGRLLSEIRLAPLTQAGVAALGRALAGEPLAETMSGALYQVTAGNPLYVVEAMRTAMLPQPDDIAGALLQSPIVQATFQVYFAPLSAQAHDLLGLAATIGHNFTLDLLASATLLNRETLLLALDELLQRTIVRDHGARAYTFCHPLLQKAAYALLTSAKRRLWQERLTRKRSLQAQMRGQ